MTPDNSEHVLRSAHARFGASTDNVPTELARHLEEALRCLDCTDLDGANAALERACTETLFSRKDAGLPKNLGTNDGAAPKSQETREESGERW